MLQTKLFVPEPHAECVPRPHLIDRLNRGLNGKPTLVSAPAGFGKTTLIVDWITQFREAAMGAPPVC